MPTQRLINPSMFRRSKMLNESLSTLINAKLTCIEFVMDYVTLVCGDCRLFVYSSWSVQSGPRRLEAFSPDSIDVLLEQIGEPIIDISHVEDEIISITFDNGVRFDIPLNDPEITYESAFITNDVDDFMEEW